jgi:hypothetical protein
MATVTKKFIRQERRHGGAPYGNVWRQRYKMVTNASGVIVDSDQATAILINDVVRLGIIPAGTELQNAELIISDAFAASTTCKIGFQYVDGVDSTAVPQNDAFFFAAGTVLSSLARLVNSATVAPVVLPKDAYLILTNAGANHSAVGILDVIVTGEVVGTP